MEKKWKFGVALAALLIFSIPAFSHSCALCYTQAASSGARFIAALRNGIFVLMVPPMFMSAGITWLAYRKRNQFSRTLTSRANLVKIESPLRNNATAIVPLMQ